MSDADVPLHMQWRRPKQRRRSVEPEPLVLVAQVKKEEPGPSFTEQEVNRLKATREFKEWCNRAAARENRRRCLDNAAFRTNRCRIAWVCFVLSVVALGLEWGDRTGLAELQKRSWLGVSLAVHVAACFAAACTHMHLRCTFVSFCAFAAAVSMTNNTTMTGPGFVAGVFLLRTVLVHLLFQFNTRNWSGVLDAIAEETRFKTVK